MTRLPATSLLALPLLASGLLAQTDVAVPAHADLADGQQSLGMPFGTPAFRTQILVDSQALAQSFGVITELRFRAERSSAPIAALNVPNVTITMSQTPAAPGTLGTSFANNVTGPTTTVFQGAVTLPAQVEGAAGPLPWNIAVPLSTPFNFTTAQGSLLIDIVGNNPPAGPASYLLDAVEAGGSATGFGRPGDNPSFDTLRMLASTGNDLVPLLITPGSFVDLTTTTGFTQPPSLLVLGLQAMAPPLDLGLLGAPTHLQYVVPLSTSFLAWQSSFIGFFATSRVGIPADPSFVDVMLFAQTAAFDPTANALGVLTSNALEVRIGDAAAPLPMQQLDSTDPAAAAGVLVDFDFGSGSRFGAVPVRFSGVFQ